MSWICIVMTRWLCFEGGVKEAGNELFFFFSIVNPALLVKHRAFCNKKS